MKSIEKDPKKLSDLKGKINISELPDKKRGQSGSGSENPLISIKSDKGKNNARSTETSSASKIISGDTKLNDFVINRYGVKVPKDKVDAKRKEIFDRDPEEYTSDPVALEEDLRGFIDNYLESPTKSQSSAELTKLYEKFRAEKKQEELSATNNEIKPTPALADLNLKKVQTKSESSQEIKLESGTNQPSERIVSETKSLEDLQKKSPDEIQEVQKSQSPTTKSQIVSTESSLEAKKNLSSVEEKSGSGGGIFQKIKEKSLSALGSNLGKDVLEKIGGSTLGESGQRLGSVLSQKSLIEKQKMEMGKSQDLSPVLVKKISEPVEMKKPAPPAPKNPESSPKQESSVSEYPKKEEKSETFSNSPTKDNETSSKDSTNVPSRDLESSQGMGITKGDINDIKSLLTSINIALNSPLMVKNNKPFRPKSNMLE